MVENVPLTDPLPPTNPTTAPNQDIVAGIISDKNVFNSSAQTTEVVQWKCDTSWGVVSVVIKVNDFCINLVNIYAPTNLTELYTSTFCLPTLLSLPAILIVMNMNPTKLALIYPVSSIFLIFDLRLT